VDATDDPIATTIDDLVDRCVLYSIDDGSPNTLGVSRLDVKDLAPFLPVSAISENPAVPLFGGHVSVAGARQRLSNEGRRRGGRHRAGETSHDL
jgi:hypothetical protein